jgi:hypothetical protein
LIAMPANPSTKVPETPVEKSVEQKFDPMRPEMPQIPGVSSTYRRAESNASGPDSQKLLQIGGALGVVLLCGLAIFWWARSRPRAAAHSTDAPVEEETAPAPALPSPIAPVHEGPTVAATTDELSKPWAAKKFTFIKPVTQESIPAIVVRLPSGGLWAFSLQGPYGSCQLEFVADLATIAAKYKYNASHPMVVSPCDGTVYDPLKVGPLGGDTWARGEIVQGSSLRPPISIDVKVRGRSIVADSIE